MLAARPPPQSAADISRRLSSTLDGGSAHVSTASVTLIAAPPECPYAHSLHATMQVAQLCFEAVLPLVEEEATAGGDASAASLQAGCTRAFERLHASAVAVSDRAGMPTQPPTIPSFWRRCNVRHRRL